MSKYSSQYNNDLREILQQFKNLKSGKNHSFLEEDSFERIIDNFNEKEQFSLALEAADYGIQQYPYSSILLIKKSDLLITLKRHKEALQILEYAELLDSRNTDLYILKTDAYLALDQQIKAAAVLEAAINDFEGDEKIDLLFELADVYDDYENFEKVFDCLIIILEQDPNNEEALHKICFWTDFTGRNEEGIRLHQKIINDFPFNHLAWFNLAAAYQGLKLYEKAIDAYQYAIAIDEKFDYAWRNIGDAYIRLHKYKEAIEALQKVLEVSRPEEIIYEAIGHCYDKMSNHAEARFNYKKASHLNNSNSRLNYKIARTYINENNWNSAIKYLEIVLSSYPAQPQYNLAMGQCYKKLNKLNDAIAYFENVIRVKPKNINGWIALLECLYKAKLFDEALDHVNFALQQTENKTIFLFYKSMFLFASGKSGNALLQLEQAMIQNPKLVKKIIELNPSILQNQQVVDIIARFKKKRI